MADCRHTANHLMRYLCSRLTNFDKFGMTMHISPPNPKGNHKFENPIWRMVAILTRNAWQSLSYSLLGTVELPPSEYL